MDNLYSSFYLYKKYEIIGDELIDLGITSIDADGTQEPVVKEECDTQCGCPEPIYRWVQTEDTVCIEVITYKLQATYSDSSTLNVECDSSTSLLKAESQPTGYTASAMTDAIIGDCVTTIGLDSQSYTYAPFRNCYSLTSVTIPNSVTSIQNYAFGGCTGLTSVDIPTSVTAITQYVFSNCKSLTSITLPESAVISGGNTFENCSALTSVNIPTATTSIDLQTFRNCYSLTSVTIPSSVTHIGSMAFRNCSGLTSVTVLATTPPTLDSTNAFSGTNDCSIYVPCESELLYRTATGWSELGDRIVCLGKYRLGLSDSTAVAVECGESSAITSGETSSYKSSIVNVVIGDCVTTIDNGAFGWCHYLTSVTISNSVTSIGDSAFENSGRLSSITIPDSVTSIGSWAFFYCSGLRNVTIGSGVKSIWYRAFDGCSNLPVENNIRYADTCAVEVIDKTLTSYTFKEDVKYIMDRTFSGCTNLTNIVIPEGVIFMGQNVFTNCSGLTSVTLPETLTRIPMQAFYNCKSLTSVTIPSSVTEIGMNGFAVCSGLESITCLATTPPILDISPFVSTNNCPLYVPANSLEDYKITWAAYKSRLQPIP